MKARRKSRRDVLGLAIALSIGLAIGVAWISTAAVALAAEHVEQATQIEAPVPEPGADGWYDARPLDESFRVRVPSTYQAFAEQGKSRNGLATHTRGVRAKATAAFGGVTSYLTSCVAQPGDERTPEQRLQEVIDRWKERGLMRFQRPVASGSVAGGVEFEVADDVKVIRSRIFPAKAGTCTVLISWRPFAKPSDEDIAKYLDSFQLTQR